jgi:curved DNA-binding protein CbpA
MKASEFMDYYEILELSSNANSGTIERMFRYLAQRYHPDNRDTGDPGST